MHSYALSYSLMRVASVANSLAKRVWKLIQIAQD